MPGDFRFLDDDAEFPFHPEVTRQGLRTSRFGLVTAADPVAAVQDTSVPKIGDRLAANLNVYVRSVRVVATFAGRIGRGEGPTYKLEVQYESPSWSGSLQVTQAGDTWTEVTASTSTITIYQDVEEQAFNAPPIAGGDGASIEVGTVEAVVKRWYSRSDFAQQDFARLITLAQGCVNDTPIALPNVMQSGTAWNLGAEQIRYRKFEFAIEGEFRGIFHHLALAPSHKLIAYLQDENGMVGTQREERVGYVRRSLTGLW